MSRREVIDSFGLMLPTAADIPFWREQSFSKKGQQRCSSYIYLIMGWATYLSKILLAKNTSEFLCISQKEKSTDRELNVKGREIMCSRKSNHIIMDRFKVLYLMQRLEK